MNPQSPVKSCVRRNMIDGKDVADALTVLTATCNAGAACTDVQNDAVGAAAQADLQAKVTAASLALGVKQKADQDARAAGKKLFSAFTLVRAALATYETSVNGIAKGDAAIINKAGCDARPEVSGSSPQVSKVEKITSALGKNARESVLRWPATAGATMFAVEVNYDPKNPSAPWTPLGTVTRRSKLVTVPNPASQFRPTMAPAPPPDLGRQEREEAERSTRGSSGGLESPPPSHGHGPAAGVQ